MGFAVVVDSTIDMSAEEYQALNITMVPLNILVGGSEFKDQVEISSEEFYQRMSEAEQLPKTAQPAPYDFAQAYEHLAKEGYDGIVSLHIAGVLSGTVESARHRCSCYRFRCRFGSGGFAGEAPVLPSRCGRNAR